MNSVNWPSTAPASCANCATSAVRSTKPRPDVCTLSNDDTTELAETFDVALREMDLDDVMNVLPVVPANTGTHNHRYLFDPSPVIASKSDDADYQILPLTSFCIRLAISTSRRQACSRNDITRSISRSLGSGISILRGLSATFGSAFFCRSDFGNASSILPSATGARDANSVFSFSI